MIKSDNPPANSTPGLAELAHELRTPLTAIIGFVEGMVGGQLGLIENPRHRDYLEIVLDSARHALSLVDGMQERAIEGDGRTAKALVPVEVALIANRCVAAMRPLAEARLIAITVTTPAGLPPVAVREQALRQVIFNLLSNALKYMPAGGDVLVEAALDEGNIRLAITDTGQGIDAATLARLNDAVATAGRPDGGGHILGGLGLKVSRRLVAEFGGRLEIASEIGQGTCVTVWIPVID